jgi:hypothetical protein
VSDAEHEQIDTDAAALGLSISGYIPWLAVGRPQTRAVRLPLADVTLLKQLKGQCGRIGGNLHQILKLANLAKSPGTMSYKPPPMKSANSLPPRTQR